MTDSYGVSVAKYDMKIKKLLQDIANDEEIKIKQYIDLKEFLPKCSERYKKDIILLLDERKLYLQYKIQDKERQIEALLKVLDYLNTLEKNKQCKTHIQEILDKITELQNEITMLRTII
jgi:hypothetical protein